MLKGHQYRQGGNNSHWLVMCWLMLGHTSRVVVQAEGDRSSVICFGTYNICNRRNTGLESALQEANRHNSKIYQITITIHPSISRGVYYKNNQLKYIHQYYKGLYHILHPPQRLLQLLQIEKKIHMPILSAPKNPPLSTPPPPERHVQT